jgi:DNA-binding response OmpR family regulator
MSSTEPVVLYVEDDALIRELAVIAFSDAGIDVLVVENGEAALTALDADAVPIRAIVTDVNLGAGPDGWAVAERARELHQALPVLYVTGASGHEWRSRGVRHSFMILKPFDPERIADAVSWLLGNAGTAGLPPTGLLSR